MSLEITWQGHETETSLLALFLLIHTQKESDRQRQRETGRRREEECEGVRGVKKVWTPAPLWTVKITWWAFRVSEDGGGRGIRSFSTLQGTAHAWLTLWIPTEPIYMLFLLPLYLILKVCQSQSLCLFQISLTSVCVRGSVRVFGRETSRRFSHAPSAQHCTQTAHSRGTLGNTALLSNVFCAACRSRGLIMLGLKAQTPPCQRQAI